MRNFIEAGDSPLMKKAEKKVEVRQMTYSTDEDGSDNEGAKKKNTDKKLKNSKDVQKKKEKEDSESEDQDGEDDESEDENDRHARLLASMEKEVIPEETEEDLVTPRKPEPVKVIVVPKPEVVKTEAPKNPPKPIASNKLNVKKVEPKKDDTKPTPAPTIQKTVPLSATNNGDANKKKDPPTKDKEKPVDPVQTDKIAKEKQEEQMRLERAGAKDKNYKNGPVVDFHEQIRKISSTCQMQAPDLSQLSIPLKHHPIKEEAEIASPGDDDMHHAINDILKDKEAGARPKTGRRASQQSSSSAKQIDPESQVNHLKELEEDIIKNHKDGVDDSSSSDKQNKTVKSGAEVDNLISELNLTV